jgi:hypothetical protein
MAYYQLLTGAKALSMDDGCGLVWKYGLAALRWFEMGHEQLDAQIMVC